MAYSYQEGIGGQESVHVSRETGSGWRRHSKNKPNRKKLCVEFMSNDKKKKFMSHLHMSHECHVERKATQLN